MQGRTYRGSFYSTQDSHDAMSDDSKASISELKDYFPDLSNSEILEMKRESPDELDEIRRMVGEDIN